MAAAINAIAATIAAFREMRMRWVITEISFLTWWRTRVWTVPPAAGEDRSRRWPMETGKAVPA